MGIRYYAYAFNPELAAQAVSDPHSILSGDPLADAWGLQPYASFSVATFEQAVPRRDMLYLDKAWGALQALTGSRSNEGTATDSHRMFEGDVTMHDMGWDPWVRVILPAEVPAIRDDLCSVTDAEVEAWLAGRPTDRDSGQESRYIRSYLGRAQEFVESLRNDGRGMVYLIG